MKKYWTKSAPVPVSFWSMNFRMPTSRRSKILAALAGNEANIFAVGDPDQAIYRFRGASSAAFHLFRRHFPQTKLVVLGKNRRSTTPILQCAFAVVDKNPPVFQSGEAAAFAYRRTPLQSAREEEASKQGKFLVYTSPLRRSLLTGRDAEAPDVVRIIEETRRHSRCKWKDFADPLPLACESR